MSRRPPPTIQGTDDHLEGVTEKKIVILGAGYGGLTIAQQLGRALGKRSKVQVVLIDANDYHYGPISVREHVVEWADHDLDHLRQILGALQSGLYPDIGAFQALYPKPS